MEYEADMNKDLIENLMDNCLPMARDILKLMDENNLTPSTMIRFRGTWPRLKAVLSIPIHTFQPEFDHIIYHMYNNV